MDARLYRIAGDHGLSAQLVAALVSVESSGNPWAIRPEPRYRYLVDCRTSRPFRELSPDELSSKIAPVDFPFFAGSREQEWWLQQCSLGPMQVMGAVAREQGFRGPYLTALCDPEVGLPIGCRVLAGHVEWAKGDVARALAAFNAGRGNWSSTAGQTYARKVLSRLA